MKVEGEAPLIETTQSDLSSVIGEQRIDALPNADRDFINYALLSPGTLPGRRGFGYDQLTEVGVGPRHMTDNAVNVDGASSVSSHGGYQLSSLMPLGSVQEFEFLRNRYSAEFGGGSGGTANVVTKSGTNDVHGSVFAFIRDDRFDAAGPFVPSGEKPPFRRGQFGATLGGLPASNQTHYFLAYDGLRSDETLIVNTGGTLPGEDGPFPFTRNQDALLTRVDHQLSPTHQISGRYNYGKYTDRNFAPRPFLARQGRIGSDLRLHSFLFAETWTASERSINEFRFQYLDQKIGIDSNSADPFEIRPSSRAGTPPVFPFGMLGQRFQMTDNFSHFLPQGRGSHHFKLGGEVHAVPVDESFSNFARGGFIFTTDQPFDPDDPTTYPVQSLFGGTNRIDRTSWQLGLYFSDDWSVRDNLTLNLGLRYDLETKSTNSDVPNSVPFLDSPRLDKNNWSPRLGLAYNPVKNTVYSDWVRALLRPSLRLAGGSKGNEGASSDHPESRLSRTHQPQSSNGVRGPVVYSYPSGHPNAGDASVFGGR